MKKKQFELSPFFNRYWRLNILKEMRIFSFLLVLGLLLTFTVHAQTDGNVTGKVVDIDGIGIPGVTVVVKGTTTGTVTNLDGEYQLSNVNQNDVLQFSFVGKKTVDVVVTSSVINATLEDDAIGLEEIVAIGYGTIKKRDLTGAVSSVKTEELKQTPVANVAQALQGKLAGVAVSSQDGRPGADIKIRIRGGGSITQSNDPLVVVDGVPGGSLSDIPADQIETIDVLKDASSTAIYGANGANGVILVTTKGLNTQAGKTKISYSGYLQTKSVTKTNDALSAQEYILHQWSYMTAAGGSATAAMESFYGLGSDYGNHYADYANIDVHDYTQDLLRDAMTQEHNISVSSATDKTNLSFNANMIDDEGIKIQSGYKRYNAALKLEHKLYDNVKVGFNVNYTQSQTEGSEGISNGTGSLMSSAYKFRPIDYPIIDRSLIPAGYEAVLVEMGFNEGTTLDDLDEMQMNQLRKELFDRQMVSIPSGFGNGDVHLDPTYDPYERTMDIKNISDRQRVRAIGWINWEIINGLTLRSEISGNRSFNESKYYDDGIALPDSTNFIADRNARLTLSRGYAYRNATTLNWEIQGLGDDHKLSVLGGVEFSKSQSNSSRISGRSYPANFDYETTFAKIQYSQISSLLAGTDDTYVINKNNFDFYNTIGVASTNNSYFGRLNYSYQGRYLFTATMRADGSSKFAPNNRWGYFPAAALAWRVSDESFMESTQGWLDNLKLRLSYGQAGADNIPYSAWNALYDVEFSNNGVITYDPKGVYPNPDLKWETTVSRNIGLDYNLFNNRIYGTFEVYANYTKDLLGQVPVAPASGFTAQYQNIGKTSNKGVEISFGADIVRQDDFRVSVNATYNYNKNNIEELADGILTDYGTDWNSTSTYPRKEFIFKEGTPVGTVQGYIYEGYYSTNDFDYDSSTGQYTLKEGVPYYDNFNQIGSYPNPFDAVRIDSTGAAVNIASQMFPGALKIKDVNGDGKITPDDATELGEIIPRHTGGFGFNVYFKGIDLGANFTYALGGHVYNIASLLNTIGSKDNLYGANRLSLVNDAYKVYDVNESGNLEAVTDPAALDALNASAKYHLPYHEFGLALSEWFEKSDYLRLNTLTVGYTLPKELTQKVAIQKLRVYFTGGNLFTLTGYSGLDPEVNSREKRNSEAYPTPGLDFGAYPRSRTFTFGVNVDF